MTWATSSPTPPCRLGPSPVQSDRPVVGTQVRPVAHPCGEESDRTLLVPHGCINHLPTSDVLDGTESLWATTPFPVGPDLRHLETPPTNLKINTNTNINIRKSTFVSGPTSTCLSLEFLLESLAQRLGGHGRSSDVCIDAPSKGVVESFPPLLLCGRTQTVEVEEKSVFICSRFGVALSTRDGFNP